mmetsp:Transcript_53329/g.137929  ORF Transcript_53329/g.137929 Transcript_53329/m.137929 type:complete len:111 (-) Transcript_53329:1716-2048(-)
MYFGADIGLTNRFSPLLVGRGDCEFGRRAMGWWMPLFCVAMVEQEWWADAGLERPTFEANDMVGLVRADEGLKYPTFEADGLAGWARADADLKCPTFEPATTHASLCSCS